MINTLDEIYQDIANAIREKTFKTETIRVPNFAAEIRSIAPDVRQLEDATMRNELIERGYDIPLNKSDAYYRAIAESKYTVISSIIKPDGKYPRIDLNEFVGFDASEYQAELYGYINRSLEGTTTFFSSRNDSSNDGKFDFLRNRSNNTLRYVKNGKQAYINGFDTNWHTFYLGDDGLTVDHTLSPWQGTQTAGATQMFPICLFASNPLSKTDLSVGNNFGECGFSYLKFLHFGKLCYFFFPILLDNEVCLYDVIGDRVYHNDGQDYFITDDPSVDLEALAANSVNGRGLYRPIDDDGNIGSL